MKDDHGKITEDVLEKLCTSLFSSEMVLRSPVLLEESGPKELTDILILIDETAIIIQSKSMLIDIAEINETKIQRIINRQEKAKKQINTTLNAQKRKTKVRAETSFGVTFELDWNTIKNRIGIVTLNITDEQYRNPEYRFQYPNLAEEHKGIIVHTFILNDLQQMTMEITTPADMLLYLETRYECVKSGKFIIANELDFLSFYKTQYPQLREILDTDNYTGCFIAPGTWEEFRANHKRKIIERREWFKDSIPLENLIKELISGIEHSINAHSYTRQESTLNYMKLIGKFSKLTRMERAQIGAKLVEKFDKTRSDKWGYFIHVSTKFKIAFLFLILNESNREKRQNFFHFICQHACHKVDMSTQLVGLTTNGAKDREHSVDALVIENVQEMAEQVDIYEDPVMFKEMELETINEWKS